MEEFKLSKKEVERIKLMEKTKNDLAKASGVPKEFQGQEDKPVIKLPTSAKSAKKKKKRWNTSPPATDSQLQKLADKFNNRS